MTSGQTVGLWNQTVGLWGWMISLTTTQLN